jgi:predicted acylesterase/phospholipase RssA
MSVPVQIALQGGGAKLVHLVAFLAAVQKAESNNIIRVTRVAGTSAGAIAGCLFCAGVDMSNLRQVLEKKGESIFKRCRKGMVRSASRLLMGKPAWDDGPLGDFLAEWLSGRKKLSEFKERPLLIVSSDLVNIRARIFHGEDDIVDSVLSSAGLPLIFRTWKSHRKSKAENSYCVDGGMCENLPVLPLMEGDQHKAGDTIIAVTFSQAQQIEGEMSMLKYFSALIDTVTSHTVHRAQALLPPSQIFEVPDPVSTLDFKSAFSRGLKDHFNLITELAGNYLGRLAERVRYGNPSVRYDPWGNNAPVVQTLLENSWRISKSFKDNALKYKRIVMTLELNSLSRINGAVDSFSLEWDFIPAAGTTVRHLEIHALPSHPAEYFGRTLWSLSNPKIGRRVDTIAVPIRNPSHADDRGLLFCFPPQSESDGPLKFHFSDKTDKLMPELLDKHSEEFEFCPTHADGPVEELVVLFWVPEGINLILAAASDSGGPLSADEVLDYAPQKTPPSPGLVGFGWRTLSMCKPLSLVASIPKPT